MPSNKVHVPPPVSCTGRLHSQIPKISIPRNQRKWSTGRDDTFKWDNDQVLTTWYHIPIVWAAYIGLVFSIYFYMKPRKALEAKWMVVAHNWFLSAWSLVMCIGATLAMLQAWPCSFAALHGCLLTMVENGWDMLYCPSPEHHVRANSKFYELFDSILFALFKKDTQLFHPLHMFHHCVAIAQVYACLHFGFDFAILGMWFNTLVHTIMYFYYGASAAKIQPVMFIKQYITTLQIIQFLSGFVLCVPYVYLHFTAGGTI
eukprot:gene3356-89_t